MTQYPENEAVILTTHFPLQDFNNTWYSYFSNIISNETISRGDGKGENRKNWWGKLRCRKDNRLEDRERERTGEGKRKEEMFWQRNLENVETSSEMCKFLNYFEFSHNNARIFTSFLRKFESAPV